MYIYIYIYRYMLEPCGHTKIECTINFVRKNSLLKFIIAPQKGHGKIRVFAY